MTAQAAAEGNCLLDHCEKDSIPQSAHPTELNVLNLPLEVCSTKPVTGFYRDGYCRTGTNDRGVHVVCASVTETFLAYTKAQGNDLSSAAPRYGFPGLKPGDNWCLCAARWSEAQKANAAPPVVLNATSEHTLKTIALAELKEVNAEAESPVPSLQ